MGEEHVADWSVFLDPSKRGLPAGTYRVRVEDIEFTEKSSRGPAINVWFTVLDEAHAGWTLTDRLSLSGQNGTRGTAFLEALALEPADEEHPHEASAFLGRILEIDVVRGELKHGRVPAFVRDYRRPSDPTC